MATDTCKEFGCRSWHCVFRARGSPGFRNPSALNQERGILSVRTREPKPHLPEIEGERAITAFNFM